MVLSDGIQKLGFRKWYERELLQSHAHMVLLVLCSVGLLGAFEIYDRKLAATQQLNVVVSVLLCVGIGLWSMRVYLRGLMQAEAVANQADCTGCGTYGRLTLVPHAHTSGGVHVQCKGCGHAWCIWT
jgi:ABC-type nickel/cobalt efflux system permease component RcnA